KGFYQVRIRLPGFTLLTFLLSRGLDPTKGVRELMHRAGTTNLRKLFQRLDVAAIPSKACPGLLDQMKSLESQITDVVIAEGNIDAAIAGGVGPITGEILQEKEEIHQKKLDLIAAHDQIKAQATAMGCL